MKRASILVLCAVIGLAVMAAAQVPAEATFEKDLVYGRADGVDLKLDMARPARAETPAPAVVCIHGGAWMSGSKNDYEMVLRRFAADGYLAVAVEYRFAPAHPWPAQIEDVKYAVRYLRARAAELHINPDKIGAVGDSAGGHLALLSGLMDAKDGLEGDGGNEGVSSKVQAVVNIYGPVDLRTWRVLPEAEAAAAAAFGKSSEQMLADFAGTADRNDPRIAQASPVTYIDAGDPPVLTYHGTKDAIVPFDQAATLQARLEAAGVKHEFVPIEGGVHGLDLVQIGIVTQGTLAFFDKWLKGETPAEETAGEEAPPFEAIPKIDAHAHAFDDMPEFAAWLERNNLRLINICLYGNRPEALAPLEAQAAHLHRFYPRVYSFASTFDLTRRDQPGYADEVTAWLDQTFAEGAVMVKLWKEVGMQLKGTDGRYLLPDDPVLDPVCAHLAARGKPLLLHAGDPVDAWRPLDPESAHYRYFSSNPEWHMYDRANAPDYEDILAAVDRLLEKHPGLTVVAAHLGNMAHDVDRVGAWLDRHPNLYVDVSARLPDLMRQPVEKVRAFFIKHQDRILYGTDIDPCQFPAPGPIAAEKRDAYLRAAEARYRNEYAYFAGSGTRNPGDSEAACLALPRSVLEKLYHANAERLIPELAP